MPEQRRVDLKAGRIFSMSLPAHGQTGLLATGFGDGDVRLLDAGTLGVVQTLSASCEAIEALRPYRYPATLHPTP